jgi:hypothetical protein
MEAFALLTGRSEACEANGAQYMTFSQEIKQNALRGSASILLPGKSSELPPVDPLPWLTSFASFSYIASTHLS